MSNKIHPPRAWHIEKKIMRDVIRISWNDELYDAEVVVNTGNKRPSEFKYWSWLFSEIILLPCTGKRDRDGVLVYEADILEADIYPGENYYLIVEWPEKSLGFELTWRKKPGAKVSGISDFTPVFGDFPDDFNIKIIGSIYEPERTGNDGGQ